MFKVTKEEILPFDNNIKIIDIFPNYQVAYMYGDSNFNHMNCLKELVNNCFIDIRCLVEWVQEQRVFTIQDYLVKKGHILLFNLDLPFNNKELLIMLQDNIDDDQIEYLFRILNGVTYSKIRICIHNQDNRYGIYHYHESVESQKTLLKKKRSSFSY